MLCPYFRIMPTLIEAGRPSALKPEEIAERLSERDARQASDTRTDAQRLMNEPEACRGALAGISSAPRSLFVPVRMTFGKPRTTPLYNPAVWKMLQNK